MSDLAAVKIVHQQIEMEQIRFIRSANKLLDCLAKANGKDALITTFENATLLNVVEQWIDRTTHESTSRHKEREF